MPDAILRLKAVRQITGLSRSTIYAKLDPHSKQYDPTFPHSVSLGARAVGFSEAEIRAWIAARIAARDVKLEAGRRAAAQGAD
ncbi:MAG: AlpA family phage regulatory protein [Hyphomicrobium sp.]